jgi:hypothetical protein
MGRYGLLAQQGIRAADINLCEQLGAGDEVCYKVYCEVSSSGLRCP